MKIQISIKSVYGNETAYPADRQAQLFADLLGRKTLTRQDLAGIQRLGYEVEVVALGVTVGKLAA